MIVTAVNQVSSNLRAFAHPVFASWNAFPRYSYSGVPHIAPVFANMKVANETSPDHTIYNHAALPSPYSLLPASSPSIIHHHQAHYRFVIYFFVASILLLQCKYHRGQEFLLSCSLSCPQG